MLKRREEVNISNGKVVIDVVLEDGQVAQGIADIDGQLSGLGGSGQKAGFGVGKLVGSLAAVGATVGVFKLLNGGMDRAISRVDTLNNAELVFENMGFAAEDSSVMMDNLVDSITGLPTPLDSAVRSVQNLAGSTQDLDKSQKVYSALNNGILGFGGSAERVDSAVNMFSRSLARGSMQGDEWNNIYESMPAVLNTIAEEMGYTTDELREGLSNGDIAMEDFTDSLLKMNTEGGGNLASLEKIAQDATKGIGTSMANARTAVANGMAGIITSIDEALVDNGLPDISEMIGMVGRAFKSAFDTIAEVIPPVVKWISTVINTIKPFMPILEPLIVGIGAFVAAFATWSTVIAVINQVRNAFIVLNAVMMANPIGLVIGVIIALIAVLVYLWNTNETFRENVIAIWEAIKTFFTSTFEFLSNLFITVWNAIIVFWAFIFTTFKETVSTVWEFIQTLTATFLSVMTSIITGGFQLIWGFISSIFSTIGNFISTTWNGIQTVISNVINFIRNIITTGFNAVQNTINSVVTFIRSIISTGFNFIQNIISTVTNAVRNRVQQNFQTMRNIINTVMNAIRSLISNIWNGIRNTTSNVLNSIKSTITNIFNSFRNIVSNAFSNVRSAVSSGMSNALSAVTGFMGNFGNAGRNIVNAIANGIKGAMGRVRDAASNLASTIRSFLPFSPAEEGPLRDIMKTNIAGSVAETIEKDNSPIKAIRETAKGIAKELDIMNEMAGMQLAFGGLSAGNASQSVHQSFISDENKNMIAELRQQNSILMNILEKNWNVEIEGESIANVVNDINGRNNSMGW